MKKKILLVVSVVLCAALLVAGSIAGTFAYLTAKMTITNTFTVGNVKIDLTESLVNLNGEQVDNGETRVHLNEYHLIPGKTYIKDPKITIAAESEALYLFIKVDNGLQNLALRPEEETDDKKTIATQIAHNGWVELGSLTDSNGNAPNQADGIYVYSFKANETAPTKYIVAKSNQVQIINVFETFTIRGDADTTTLPDTDGNGKIDPKIEITAYAVQGDTFATAVDAWNATFGADTTPTP